jgi:signal transduction histidine kinase
MAPVAMRAALVRKGVDVEDAKAHAAAIEDVVRRMETLMRGLLDVASMDAGKLSIAPRRCEVAGLLADVEVLFTAVAAKKGIALRANSGAPDLAVHADCDRVLQVLANLVGNALKFTRRNGTVEIHVGDVDGWACFEVRDEGRGIPPEHLSHVFDRFWKHDGANSRGTGLGLFIAKSLVEAHGGEIHAHSEIDRGTTFSFTLPLDVSPSARGPSAPSPSRNLSA